MGLTDFPCKRRLPFSRTEKKDTLSKNSEENKMILSASWDRGGLPCRKRVGRGQTEDWYDIETDDLHATRKRMLWNSSAWEGEIEVGFHAGSMSGEGMRKTDTKREIDGLISCFKKGCAARRVGAGGWEWKELLRDRRVHRDQVVLRQCDTGCSSCSCRVPMAH